MLYKIPIEFIPWMYLIIALVIALFVPVLKLILKLLFVINVPCCFCGKSFLSVDMRIVTLPNGTDLYFCPGHFDDALDNKKEGEYDRK